MTVIIGVDSHKATHTAVAIGGDEAELAKIRIRATRQQVTRLLEWAEPFGRRTWAIQSAGELGYLLAQQLVDVGEHVVDVPATLASRVRVLGTPARTRTIKTMRCLSLSQPLGCRCTEASRFPISTRSEQAGDRPRRAHGSGS